MTFYLALAQPIWLSRLWLPFPNSVPLPLPLSLSLSSLPSLCACLVNLFVPFVYHFCLFPSLRFRPSALAIVSCSRPGKKNAGQLAARPGGELKGA